MKFKSASAVESLVWEMKLADYPRALNRQKIDEVFNGFPPYTDSEVTADNINVNVNFLEGAQIAHDARSQMRNALMTPSPAFTVEFDSGPRWKRDAWANYITKSINRIMRESSRYRIARKGVFSLDVLHGIGPTVYRNRERWEPKCKSVADVLIPSGTELDLDNLPFFAVYENYTAQQLKDLISGPNIDPGWQIENVKKAIRWVDQEAQKLMSASWPEVWSPEKMSERIKEDSGLYSSDRVPTVDCWRFFYFNDSGKTKGWSQKVVLDAWGEPGVGGAGGITIPRKPGKNGQNDPAFLYDSGNRKFASNLNELIHFQFADVSSVAPFRYHSVRSLGFLLYAVCQLQNRLRCKFNEALFENLMQFFRVTNPADAERAMRINLTDKTPLPDGIQFVKADERWKIDKALVEMGFELNRQSMQDNSSAFTQDYDLGEKPQETATRTMAKVNAGTSLVASMLNDAYEQQAYQYREICRRFCIANSGDNDVRRFRNEVLSRGVPDEMLNAERWIIQPVRVIGAGNRTIQIATADKLMMIYTKLDPSAQQYVKRFYISANTEDYDLANQLVPEQPKVTDSIHDAQLSLGTLMQGIPVLVKDGTNHEEEIVALFGGMVQVLRRIEGTGSNPPIDQILGLQTVASHVEQLIAFVAQDSAQPHHRGMPEDKSVKQKVKLWSDDLAKIMNQLKGYAQRWQESQKQQQQGQLDPNMAKIQAEIIRAQMKANLAKQSHAERTAQRQITFEQQFKQEQQRNELELVQKAQDIAIEGQRKRMASFQE